MTRLLFQWRYLPQGLPNLRQAPVFLEFALMQYRPLPDKAEGRAGVDGSSQQRAVEIKLSLKTLVFGVEVWWFVVVVEHSDDDPEEDGYRWHGSILAAYSLIVSGGITRSIPNCVIR